MKELVAHYKNLLNEITTAAEMPSQVVPVFKKTMTKGPKGKKMTWQHVENKPMGLLPGDKPGESRAESLLKHQQSRLANILRTTPTYKMKATNAAERMENMAKALNMQVQRKPATDVTPDEPVVSYKRGGVPHIEGETLAPGEEVKQYLPYKRPEVPIPVGGITAEKQKEAAKRVEALRGKAVQIRRAAMTPERLEKAKAAKGIEGYV